MLLAHLTLLTTPHHITIKLTIMKRSIIILLIAIVITGSFLGTMAFVQRGTPDPAPTPVGHPRDVLFRARPLGTFETRIIYADSAFIRGDVIPLDEDVKVIIMARAH